MRLTNYYLQQRTATFWPSNPATVMSATGGTATAQFDVATASNAGAGLAFTLPNLLNPSAPATTSTDARKPTIGAAVNGVPILVCSASGLLVPLYAGINSATTFWISFHARVTTALGNPVPFSVDVAGGGGANVRKLLCQRDSGEKIFVFNADSTLCRSANPGTIWTLNTWVHYLLELNLGTGAPEADRCVLSKDAVPLVSVFADVVGAPGAMPVSMQSATGFMNLLSQDAATGSNGLVAEITNINMGGSAMSGVTSGCLTADARTFLSNYRRPT